MIRVEVCSSGSAQIEHELENHLFILPEKSREIREDTIRNDCRSEFDAQMHIRTPPISVLTAAENQRLRGAQRGALNFSVIPPYIPASRMLQGNVTYGQNTIQN